MTLHGIYVHTKDVTQVSSADVFPGMTFCFCEYDVWRSDGSSGFFTSDQMHTVVAVLPDRHECMLLSSRGVLSWHTCELGNVIRVVDTGHRKKRRYR